MKVNSFHLANYAEVRDSLVFSMGAFPEWWTVMSLPSTTNLAIVLVVDLSLDELPSWHELGISLARPSDGDEGEQIASVKFSHAATDLVTDGPFFQPIVFNFGVEFQAEGKHRFAVSDSNRILAETSVRVRLGPPSEQSRP